MERLNSKLVHLCRDGSTLPFSCLVLSMFIVVFLTCCDSAYAQSQRQAELSSQEEKAVDEMAKLVNESEKRKREIARALQENKKAYDQLERELSYARKSATENLIKLQRVIAFRRLMAEQNIVYEKAWWNAEMALRAVIEDSLRRQATCRAQMEELDRLEKVLERNLREMVEAESSFRKNLQRLVSVSRDILKKRGTLEHSEDSSLGLFFSEIPPSQASLPQQKLPKLIIPVDGVVESSVELKKDVDSIPLVYSKGVFIKAREGTPVRAVADGRVMFAGWFREFGRTVIIDHGNHYFSVTTYLGSLRVQEGGRVMRGDVIGDVAQSEILGESGIYFEWRHNGKPLDVIQWFALKTNEKKGE
ncbi:MAG: peptidoglycan DD-metalloendopeptidase family protein [Thermodesulforhabdaceae bacterium]